VAGFVPWAHVANVLTAAGRRFGSVEHVLQIPAEEYWGIMRDMRRMRINVLATALGMIIPILILTAVAGIRILILLPVVMSFWFLFYMPRWRRRVRLQARNLQRWQLHPE
jgi:hypothetical protein